MLGATSYTFTGVVIASGRMLESGAGPPDEEYRLVFTRLGRT